MRSTAAGVQAASADISWKAIDRNSKDYIELKTKDKVAFYKTPDSVLKRQLEIWEDVLKKRSEENPMFKNGMRPIHPGEILREEYLAPLGMSANALSTAAELSAKYINDRHLPDKAIDLIDEAASRIRMEVESKPEEIENLDRRIIQLKIEE